MPPLIHNFKMAEIVKAIVRQFTIAVPVTAPPDFDSKLLRHADGYSCQVCEPLTVLPINRVRRKVDGLRWFRVMFRFASPRLRESKIEVFVLFHVVTVSFDYGKINHVNQSSGQGL